jgi:hypothetical protein
VGQLIDDRHLRAARDDRVDGHLFERHASILNLLARNDFDITQLGSGVGSAMRFNEANDDVNASAPEIMGFVEHSERFSNSGRGTDVQLELSALAPSDKLEEIGLVARAQRVPAVGALSV